MPVSTRSKKPPATTLPNIIDPLPPRRNTCLQEQMPLPSAPAPAPADALKDKMRALTLLYEQHKRSLKDKHRDKDSRFSSHPSVDLFHSSKKTPTNLASVEEDGNADTFANNCSTRLLPDDFKENQFVGFYNPNDQVPLPPSKVARKLPMEFGLGTLNENASAQHQEPDNAGADRSRILVFVRLRPMMYKEREAGAKCCVRIVNKRDVYLAESSNGNDYLRLKRLRGRHFTFDASFPDSSSQHEIYSTTTAQVVEAVLKGRNGSVFCYGATGAGKTYTMLGTVENPGVMVLAIKDLFDKIRQRSSAHLVHLSYLEVYNETVRDLLSPGRPLVLREDKQGIVAAGLTQYRAYSSDEVMALLHQGNLNRTTEPTRANETSSRSHAILQVAVEYQIKDASKNNTNRVGKLSLIDLAGSERALATDQRTLRSLEGANINKSLLALSSCINALVEGKKHIPYRNSKLTQLLKDSLGGTCITVMIANISPSSLSFGETQNTLHWADRAKEIRIKACDANEVKQMPDSEMDQARLLLELQKENRGLRMELAQQQQKLITIQAQTLAAATAASPTPSKAAAFLSPTPPSSHQPNGKRKPRTSFLGGGSCFVPELKGKAESDKLRELSKTVKTLEAEIERINKDYAMQIKEKDGFIRELSKKVSQLGAGAGAGNGSQIQKKETTTTPGPGGGGRPMKSPGRSRRGRVTSSPTPTAKKRSFWDITTADSPSVVRLTGRKTKSHTAAAVAPSMLPQPGFARQRNKH